MKRYKNDYRIDSARLKSWDYTSPWWYYVTLNTKVHNMWFGEIVASKMELNELGLIANDNWLSIPEHYPEVELDYYVVMPNHIHGIIILNPLPNVETGHAPSLHSLGNVIGSFKSAVTMWAHKNRYEGFYWQPRFYDRIIRNEIELKNIRKYIEQNPLKWKIEKAITENLDFI